LVYFIFATIELSAKFLDIPFAILRGVVTKAFP